MSSSKPSDFAPPWLKCVGCMVEVVQFPLLLVVAGSSSVQNHLLLQTSASAFLSLHGLNCLLNGRAQPTFFKIAMNSICRLIQAVLESWRRK
jgi:hypothetical protein